MKTKKVNTEKQMEDSIEDLDKLLNHLDKNRDTLSLINEINDLKARIIQLEILVSNLNSSQNNYTRPIQNPISPVYSSGTTINPNNFFTTTSSQANIK